MKSLRIAMLLNLLVLFPAGKVIGQDNGGGNGVEHENTESSYIRSYIEFASLTMIDDQNAQCKASSKCYIRGMPDLTCFLAAHDATLELPDLDAMLKYAQAQASDEEHCAILAGERICRSLRVPDEGPAGVDVFLMPVDAATDSPYWNQEARVFLPIPVATKVELGVEDDPGVPGNERISVYIENPSDDQSLMVLFEFNLNAVALGGGDITDWQPINISEIKPRTTRWNYVSFAAPEPYDQFSMRATYWFEDEPGTRLPSNFVDVHAPNRVEHTDEQDSGR